MLKEFESTIAKIIRSKYDGSFYFEDDEFEDALEQTMNHLLANNILFLKDIRAEEFVESLWQYIMIKRRVL
ncbi:hypothetical protein R9X47_17530 [Wukongibacter baidiensis]|uniref:hypothetical protein n=1 Tax=Wukongibacter baidiensis TaxID=1723361 RepID=UPI003D7F9BDE